MSICQSKTSQHRGKDPSSFRDPSGFIYRDENQTLLRQVNQSYADDFRCLSESGLYDSLVADELLVPHECVETSRAFSEGAFCVIQPRPLEVISYPYEWCFSAYQDAALATLKIQERALKHGMSLKDATAYNIQFIGSKPIFIDTLSFEKYVEGEPWQAYNQFCQHFLAPLALMSKVDVTLNRLMAVHLNGVPLDIACKMLPWRSRLSAGLLMHLFAHAKMVARHSDTTSAATERKASMSLSKSQAILDSLKNTVKSLKYSPGGTEWADYYQNTSYGDDGLAEKKQIISDLVTAANPKITWDLGANTGVFSRLASEKSETTVAWDIDPSCVEKCYLAERKEKATKIQPLLLDLTNPSGNIGWAHSERLSLADRGPVDLVMALALVHHLAIANNVPLPKVAEFLSQLGRNLIIEWVPKSDPQVKRLLRSREDIFANYTLEDFEKSFAEFFQITSKTEVGSDGRILYLMACE